MFWLGLLLMVAFVPGYTGASVPTQWAVLSAILPFSLWYGRPTIGHKLLAGFLCYAALSALWSLNLYSWGLGFWFACIWVLAYHWGTLHDDLRPMWKGMAVGAYVSVVLAIAQALDLAPVLTHDPFRPAGLFFSPALFGVVLGLVLVGLASHRLWWYTPPLAIGLILSGSRGGIVVLTAGLLARFAGWMPATGLVAAGAVYFAATLDPSDAQRLQVWGVALNALTLFGQGAGSFMDLHYVRHTGLLLIRPEYVHNDYLQLLYEYGPAVLAPAIVFGMALRQPSHPEFPTAFAFAVAAAFFFPLYTPVTAFIGCAVAGSILHSWHHRRRLSDQRRHALVQWLDRQETGLHLTRSEAVPAFARATLTEAS